MEEAITGDGCDQAFSAKRLGNEEGLDCGELLSPAFAAFVRSLVVWTKLLFEAL
jgi:hypothetical protein